MIYLNNGNYYKSAGEAHSVHSKCSSSEQHMDQLSIHSSI